LVEDCVFEMSCISFYCVYLSFNLVGKIGIDALLARIGIVLFK
jgi:hypothetical protein